MAAMDCVRTQNAADASAHYLLRGLPERSLELLSPLLEPVELRKAVVLHKACCELSHVYFPTTATVSLTYFTQDGAGTEFAVVGNEGVVGIALFLGGKTTPSSAVVQTAGSGLRLRAGALLDAFSRSFEIQCLMLHYTQALLCQLAQTAICNRHHSIDQQLCRWLLMRFDRVPGGELLVTQQLIANMLGVRRESVTGAAQRLQQAGLIQSARGCMRLLDRRGLEAMSCECYRVITREYARLLPGAAGT